MAYIAAVTVPSTSVSAVLNGFPLYVNLADMPELFWENVSVDGHDIRVKDGSDNDLPFDLVYIVPEEEAGCLFVKLNLTNLADTIFYIHYGQHSLSPVYPADSNGRNAVWSAYHRVVSFLDGLTDRTGSGEQITYDSYYIPLLNGANLTTDIGCHQGMIFDYDNNAFIGIGTNSLKRYVYSGGTWNLDVQNTDPCAAAGGVNHCGSGFLKDGKIYIPQTNGYVVSKLSEYDAVTLEFIRTRDLKDSLGNYADYTASCCWVPALDRIVFGSYSGDGTKLYKHEDNDTLDPDGTITIANPVTYIQGIAWWRGAFWVTSDDDNYLYRISLDGAERNKAYYLATYTYIEGISAAGNALYMIASNSDNHGVPIKLSPWTQYGVANGLYFPNNNNLVFRLPCARYTQYSIGLTARFSRVSSYQTQIFLDYTKSGSSDATKRCSMGFGSVKGQLGIWNDTDAWLYRNPLTDDEYSGLFYVSNFSEETVGAQPSGWTEVWNASVAAITVQQKGLYGRNCARYQRSSTGSVYVLKLDSPASVADGEILAIASNQSAVDHSCRVYFRGSGSATDRDCYFAFIQPSNGNVGIQLYNGATSTTLGAAAKGITNGKWYYIRTRFVGTALKLKVWEVGTAEPAAWDVEVTDATHSAGWVGIGSFTQSSTAYVYYDYFAMSVAANPATVPLCKDDSEVTNHLVGVMDSTTERKLYHNRQVYTDSGVAEAPPADADCIYVGRNFYVSQATLGFLEMLYLYPGILSADWLNAEYDNRTNSGDFYAISSGEPEPDLSETLSEQAQIITDNVSYSLLGFILKSVTDQIHINETINYKLATSVIRNVKDTAQVINDSKIVIYHPAFHGQVTDRAEVIREIIKYGLTNLAAPTRWVAPLTITPRTESGIAPLYLSAYPVRHPSKYFEPRIKSYGAFTRAITAPVGFIRTGDVSVQVLDPDNVIRRTASQKTIKKADAELRLGPEGGSFMSFLRPWKRKVTSMSQVSSSTIAFNMKDNIFDLLDRKFPTVITEDNFPNLPENLSTTWANHVIGAVASKYGAVPCPLVDTVSHQYLANLYISKSVDGVYRKVTDPEVNADYELVSPSEYTVVQTKFLNHYDGGGLYCTIIQFNADQGDKQIRANLTGIYDEDTGDLLYTNFADYFLGILQYLTILNNLGDVINLDSFAETREKVAHLVCAGAVTTPITFGEWLTRLQRSSNIDLYTDKNDRVAIHFTEDDELPILNMDDVLRLYKGSIRQTTADPSYNRFRYKYAPDYVDGTWTEKIYDHEEDQNALGEVAEDPEDIQLYFVRDEDTALEIMLGRAQYCTLESFKFEGSAPLIPILETIELARLIRVSHFGGFDAAGYLNKQFKILELTTDIDKLQCNFKGIIRKLPPPGYVETTPDGSGSGGDADADRKGIYDYDLEGSTVMPALNCRPGPYSNGKAGEYFAFFKKSGSILDPYRQKKILCFYTANYGVTWERLDQANEPITVNSIHSYDCCVDTYANDGIVHIAISENAGLYRHYYVTFDMNTKTWGSSEIVTTTTGLFETTCVSIECRYPGGEPVIFYNSPKRPGTIHPEYLYHHCSYAIKIGSSWQVDLEVTPDGYVVEYWAGGAYAWADFNFYMQRVLPGRDNRMHFFILGNPWYRQFVITMNSNRAMNYPPRYYKQNKQMGHIGVTVGWTSADKKTLLLLKRYGDYLYADSLSDSNPATFNRSTKIEDEPSFTGDFTVKMSGFFGEQGGTFYMNKRSRTTEGDLLNYGRHRTSSNGYDWSDGIQSSPYFEHGGNYGSDMYGQYIIENGRSYIASFSGTDFPTFRWQRVSSLPYSA